MTTKRNIEAAIDFIEDAVRMTKIATTFPVRVHVDVLIQYLHANVDDIATHFEEE